MQNDRKWHTDASRLHPSARALRLLLLALALSACGKVDRLPPSGPQRPQVEADSPPQIRRAIFTWSYSSGPLWQLQDGEGREIRTGLPST